jgi:hypothetical protein
MISTANCGHMTSLFRTLDGIDVGGHRLADEVRAFRLRPDMTSLDSISFIGDGIGGLYARYAIGVLLDNDGERLCQGLKPCNYISLSTPHLGVRGCVSLWQVRRALPSLSFCNTLSRLSSASCCFPPQSKCYCRTQAVQDCPLRPFC